MKKLSAIVGLRTIKTAAAIIIFAKFHFIAVPSKIVIVIFLHE